MRARTLLDAGVYLAVRTVIAAVQAMPLACCASISETLSVVLYDCIRLRRHVIDDNLRHAFPHLGDTQRRRIARGMWRHLLLMAAEIAHAPRKIHQTNWPRHVRIPEMESLVRVLLSDRPKVVISGHFGNFELAGYLLGLFGFGSHSIARRLDNPFLDRFVNQFRGSTGQRMVTKDGSGDQIAEVLRGRGVVSLLGDQSAGRKGCWVSFFGRPASTHKAVAVLSLGSGAPLLITYARRLGHPLQYEIGLEGVADPMDSEFSLGTVPLLAQWYTDCLEQIIVRSPEQYWWLHRRWKGAPPSVRQPTRAA